MTEMFEDQELSRPCDVPDLGMQACESVQNPISCLHPPQNGFIEIDRIREPPLPDQRNAQTVQCSEDLLFIEEYICGDFLA